MFREKKKKQKKRIHLRKIKNSLFLSGLIFLSSCGYKLSQPSLYTSYQTIEVPYVKGDVDGLLTSKIVSALTSNTQFRYVSSNGDIILKAEIVDKENTIIGYQYDHRSDGSLINRLVPNENRSSATVKVTLLSGVTDEILYDPFEVNADADYDFVNSDTFTDLSFINQSGVTTSVLPFSLGQLNAWQDASTASLSVLYRKVAVKIIEALEEL